MVMSPREKVCRPDRVVQLWEQKQYRSVRSAWRLRFLLWLESAARFHRKERSMGLLLLIILIILLVGATPSWPYSRNWGYAPSSILGLLLIVLLALILFDFVQWSSWGWGPHVVVR
jgi:hypothetical protein